MTPHTARVVSAAGERMATVTDVTLWLDEDEWWPWVSIVDEPSERAKSYIPSVSVDEATAQRWRDGLAAAEAIQAEMSAAFDEARKNLRT